MPDWLTHSLVGWITGKITKSQVELVIIGALIPDINKLAIVSKFFGTNLDTLFHPIHTPVGAFLIAGMITLFFDKIKTTFSFLGIGIATHFILDLLLVNVSGGMTLLFPFSWEQSQLHLVRSDDPNITIITIIAALFTYVFYFAYEKKKQKKSEL